MFKKLERDRLQPSHTLAEDKSFQQMDAWIFYCILIWAEVKYAFSNCSLRKQAIIHLFLPFGCRLMERFFGHSRIRLDRRKIFRVCYTIVLAKQTDPHLILHCVAQTVSVTACIHATMANAFSLHQDT